MSTNKSVVKSASIISLGILASRVLGFVRDVVIANFFGTSASAEAFFVAFRIPNLFRDLLGEGAANSTIVPVFSEYKIKQDKKEFFKLVNIVANLFFIVLAVITLCGLLFAPFVIRLIAPGFIKDPEKLSLTIKLTRLVFPYLILIGLTAYSMGILHTFKIFLPGAVSPCLLNLSLIISAVVSSYLFKQPILGLAIGVLAGGFLQLLVQIPSIFKLGYSFKPIFDFKHPAAKQIGRLLIPRVFGNAVYQLNVFVDTICASFSFIVGTGAVAAIYYANRLIQFPLAIFAVALATAMLPTMSELAAKENMDEFKKLLYSSIKKIFLVMIPSSVGLIVLSKSIIGLLFQRGEFSAYSTDITSYVLVFYALGLFSYSATKILISGFHSLKDTKTPVKIASLCLVINVILNLILMHPLKVGGLALASAFSATVNFSVLFYFLKKRIGIFTEDDFLLYCIRVCLAALIMGACLFILLHALGGFNEIFRLAVTIIVGIVSFISSCFIFKIKESEILIGWILKKK